MRTIAMTLFFKRCRIAVASLMILLIPIDASAADRPNILFVAIDDLNDWVGFLNGHPQVKTPHMDRLAQRGVIFSNAHCAAPLCCPSRAAVFSGKQPYNTGVYDNSDSIRERRPEVVLLPQWLERQGYRTIGTGKLLHRGLKGLCQEVYGTEQRWSPFRSKEPQPVAGMTRPLNGMPNDRQQLQPGRFSSFDWGAVNVSDREMGDGRVTDWAIRKLISQAEDDAREQPIFLAIGYYRPHIPLYAPQAYFDLYPADDTIVPEVPTDDLHDLSPSALALAHSIQTAGLHQSVVQHGQWKDAVAAYLACVSFVDAQIGRLLDALDHSAIAENTMIVLWSDHGWHLGEKEHWGKTTGWERATRVPLVIVPTKAKAASYPIGSTCAQVVSLIDLYPTLIDMCGLEQSPDLDGVSLAGHLLDPSIVTNRVVITTVNAGTYSARDNRWRYILYADGTEELYDHQDDPQEWQNLADNPIHTSTKARLAQSLPSK